MPEAMRFGRIEVRPAQRQVLVDGQPAAIAARAYDVLWTLIQHRDRVITKNELLDLVWPGVVVEEHNLHTQVSLLRKVIGPRAIATIPGRGYRFVADSSALADQRPTSSDPPPSGSPPEGNGRARPLPSPAHPTLFGRETDLDALGELLHQSRVLTICGPGGIGKTTAARALIDRRVADDSADTAWVELSTMTDASMIPGAIAVALNLGQPTDWTAASLCRALARRPALVVLDNCEHVIEAVADLVQSLLAASPALRFLATSREPLKVRDEQCYILEGLACAASGTVQEEARNSAALQLLEERARRNDNRFELPAEQVDDAIRLCQALEGSPLGIEMAASRIHLFGIAGVVERLGERLQFLTSGARHPVQRHSSLWATLSWSYSLLSESAQQALRRLSVFVGPFEVATAERLLQRAGHQPHEATEAIAELVAKSLLAEVRGEPPRRRLVETTRMFGAELLGGQERDSTLRHHEGVMTERALHAEEQHWLLSDKAWLTRYISDVPDLLAAFDRACERNDADTAAAIGFGLRAHLLLKGMDAPSRQVTHKLLALLPHAGPLAETRIWTFVSSTNPVGVAGIPRIEATRRRLSKWRERGDEVLVYEALCRYVHDLSEQDDHLEQAEAELQTVTRLVKAEWPPRRRYLAARAQATIARMTGRPDFEVKQRAALRLATEAGDIGQIARCHVNLAADALLAGRNGEALALCRTATDATVRNGAIFLLPNSLIEICVYAVNDDFAAAKLAGLRALERAVGMGVTLVPMDCIALLAARIGRPSESAQLLGAWDAWAPSLDMTRDDIGLLVLRLTEAALDGAIGRERQLEQRSLGATLAEEDVHALALTILYLPELAESAR